MLVRKPFAALFPFESCSIPKITRKYGDRKDDDDAINLRNRGNCGKRYLRFFVDLSIAGNAEENSGLLHSKKFYYISLGY